LNVRRSYLAERSGGALRIKENEAEMQPETDFILTGRGTSGFSGSEFPE
jgi:hypothetical protein